MMYNDILFIIQAAAARCQINHKTVGLTCVFCHQLSRLLLEHYNFNLAVSNDAVLLWRKSTNLYLNEGVLLVLRCRIIVGLSL